MWGTWMVLIFHHMLYQTSIFPVSSLLYYLKVTYQLNNSLRFSYDQQNLMIKYIWSSPPWYPSGYHLPQRDVPNILWHSDILHWKFARISSINVDMVLLLYNKDDFILVQCSFLIEVSWKRYNRRYFQISYIHDLFRCLWGFCVI